MNNFTSEQRAFCVKEVYKNDDCYEVVPGLFLERYGVHGACQCPSVSMIKTWVTNFEGTGSTHIAPTEPRVTYPPVEPRPEFGHGTMGNDATVGQGNGLGSPSFGEIDIKVEPAFEAEETQDCAGQPQDMIEFSEEIKQEYIDLEVTPDIVVESRIFTPSEE